MTTWSDTVAAIAQHASIDQLPAPTACRITAIDEEHVDAVICSYIDAVSAAWAKSLNSSTVHDGHDGNLEHVGTLIGGQRVKVIRLVGPVPRRLAETTGLSAEEVVDYLDAWPTSTPAEQRAAHAEMRAKGAPAGLLSESPCSSCGQGFDTHGAEGCGHCPDCQVACLDCRDDAMAHS